MEKQKKVLDASVIIKAFIKEDNSEIAAKLIKSHVEDEIKIIIPELAFLEVINSFRFKNKDESALKKIEKDLIEFQFEIVDLNEDLLNKTIEISIANNLTIYDSVYIAIAQFHGCPLITADSALFKIPNVISLEKI